MPGKLGANTESAHGVARACILFERRSLTIGHFTTRVSVTLCVELALVMVRVRL
jgi:hypothetical protein